MKEKWLNAVQKFQKLLLVATIDLLALSGQMIWPVFLP